MSLSSTWTGTASDRRREVPLASMWTATAHPACTIPAHSSSRRTAACARIRLRLSVAWARLFPNRSRNEYAVPHDLATFRNGDVSFYSAREPAWHRLGTVTPHALNAKEALEAAHLDAWDIRKQPLTSVDHEGNPVPVPGRFATVRRNPDPDGPPFDTLGVVGEDYRIVQNEEAFEFLTALVDDGDATFETAGVLRGGARVFVTMRLPRHVRIAGDDRLDLYVAVATGHDGEFAFHAFPTPVRVVCQNTLSVALRRARNVHVVRHDQGVAPKLAEARSIMKVTFDDGDVIGRAAQEMLGAEVTKRDFDNLVEEHFLQLPPRPSRRRLQSHQQRLQDLRQLAWDAPTQEVGRGTAWGAFNALSEWTEWVRPQRPASPGAAEAVLLGRTATARQRAWDLLAPSWASRITPSGPRR
jgi:phage/plasmid-like protein (TIGR03299 family)